MTSVTRPGVGIGQLLLRISQFNECQAKRPAENQMQFWREFVDKFFYFRATYKYIVWLTDHDTRSFQLFQLGTETLPRFYNVIYSSSISSVYYVLENPREYCLDSRTYLLFSPKTRVEYKYENGCRVITKGFLRVTFSDELKIILWEFEAKCHEEYLPTSIFREKRAKRQQRTSLNLNAQDTTPCTPSGGEISLDSLPKSQVNQFGLPPPVMRCFEITEVINYMKDLIDFAMERQLPPLQSLELYHQEMIDKSSMGGSVSNSQSDPESYGWNGTKMRISKQASFLQPHDDQLREDESNRMAGQEDQYSRSHLHESQDKTESPQKKPDPGEMDINTSTQETTTEDIKKIDPLIKVELDNIEIKEEKQTEKPEEKIQSTEGNEKPSEKEEDRMEDEEEDQEKSEERAKVTKKRIRKTRVTTPNTLGPNSTTKQLAKRKKK